MSVTQEAVKSNLEIGHNDLFSLLAFVWLCGVASNRALKIWCGGAAEDRTQGSHSDRHNPLQPVNSIVTYLLFENPPSPSRTNPIRVANSWILVNLNRPTVPDDEGYFWNMREFYKIYFCLVFLTTQKFSPNELILWPAKFSSIAPFLRHVAMTGFVLNVTSCVLNMGPAQPGQIF